MILGLIIVIISFLLDGLLSLFQLYNINNIYYFQVMLTITSLVLIYPYLSYKRLDYYKMCIIAGILYDITYTDTFLLNTILFIVLGYVIEKSYNYFTNNIINGIIINIAIIFMYRLLTLAVLNLVGYNSIRLSPFIEKELSIVLNNTIFYIIFYIIINYISRKYKIKCLN